MGGAAGALGAWGDSATGPPAANGVTVGEGAATGAGSGAAVDVAACVGACTDACGVAAAAA